MTATLVIDQLAQAAEHAPQAPLLSGRSGEEWQHLTNARAWAQSGAVASWLIAQGFGPDGRSLAVPAGDTPQRTVLFFGALRAGALVVPGPASVEFAVLSIAPSMPRSPNGACISVPKRRRVAVIESLLSAMAISRPSPRRSATDPESGRRL